MKTIRSKKESGFTLIEVLMALTIMSIIMVTFSSIILNTTKLYKEEINKRTEVQKSILLTRWLKNKIDSSSSSYVSNKDNKLTIKEKGSNKLFKITLYQSRNIPAVGIEKYGIQDNILRYIDKKPLVNGIKDITIKKVVNDINNKSIFDINIKFTDSNNYYHYLLY